MTREIVCYCLKSAVCNRTYVGASVDIDHRIRQHNGQLTGGAKYTSKNRPWEIKLVVRGFSTWREALQFEWRWKKVRVRYGKMSPLERRKECLRLLMLRKPWNDLPLTITHL